MFVVFQMQVVFQLKLRGTFHIEVSWKAITKLMNIPTTTTLPTITKTDLIDPTAYRASRVKTSATQQAAQFGNPYTPASYDICRNIVNVGVHVLRNCCICMEKNLD